ncbi:MAG: pyridoxal phosphate-dependent aminotransferase [Deltaproteobacteria bacterium]|nr:pyridoxal phosphate-dependent aminotransferase [Deltaproteobacteria bacterium]
MELNPIERRYRALVETGREVRKLYPANPNDEGISFPGEVLSRCYTDYFRAQEYRPDPKGLRPAREAIATYYTEQGAAVDPERILLTSGTSESFFYLFSLLAEPSDNILTPTPSYPLFDEIARLAHVQLKPYRLDEARAWAIDLDSVREAINERTRAIVIVSPHNPTGMVADVGTLRQIAAIANERGLPIICDEVFSEFYYGPGSFPRAIAVAQPDLCFTLNGISKMLALPAMKCSWIAMTGEPKRVAVAVDRLAHIADTFLSCHYPIQRALPTILTRGKSFLESYRAEVAQRRATALEILYTCPALRFHPPMGGFYLMAEVTKGRWQDENDCICDLLTQHGLFPHPGYFYDHEQGIHLVLSTMLEPNRIQEGLTRLCAAVTSS